MVKVFSGPANAVLQTTFNLIKTFICFGKIRKISKFLSKIYKKNKIFDKKLILCAQFLVSIFPQKGVEKKIFSLKNVILKAIWLFHLIIKNL